MCRFSHCYTHAKLILGQLPGAKQLFWGDLHSGERNFQPLFHFLATDIVFVENRRRLDVLPRASRAGILVAVATFLPYYDNVMVRLCMLFEPKSASL